MDSWDEIDWDQKISDETKPEETICIRGISESDGNYFEINQEKKKKKEEIFHKNSHKQSKKNIKYILPFSYKDLCDLRNNEFHDLIFKCFGELERFLMTHESELSDESLVELIKIDVTLLQIPFIYHNRLLLQRLVQIESFWHQIISFIKSFYEQNSKDPKYLLLIDTKGFFESIEALIFWFITHNYFNDDYARAIVENLKATIESYSDKKFLIEDVNEETNGSAFEIFPNLSDLHASSMKFEKIKIKGKYLTVFEYLKINLALLKEDFMHKLKNGFQELRNSNVIRNQKTGNAIITTKVRIEKILQKVWNINCPLIIAKNAHTEIFNGQMICLTSNKNCSDLIVATVLRNIHLERLIPPNSIIIEIIKCENIENIFDRDLIMVEPKAFFDPYAQVFAALKSLNEYNFPFEKRILELDLKTNPPKYEKPENFSYQNQLFKLDSNWQDLNFGLEKMQMKALKTAVCEDFTLIVGPPGTGKSFIGIEIVKVLLENTKEKILVLTQTNNALDKFLIGCSKFTDQIARFGAQCKEKELSNFIVKHNTSQESKNYLRKLQIMQRDIVSDLIESDSIAELIFKEISFHYRLVEEVNQLDNFQNTKDKRIFGMTTSFAAHNNSLTKMLKAGIVLIEEASEILESHVIASLTKETAQLIMIGDHNQLRPQINSIELQKFYFNISLYERLIMNKFPHITLDIQMRMRPEFCDLIRETIYNDLKDGEIVKQFENVKGMNRNLYFFTHNHPESVSETSKENSHEVDFILKFYKKLLSFGNNSEQITILTPYAAQAKKFRDKLNQQRLPNTRVAVLDAYQGEESEIILLSLVRSNKGNDIGFLTIANRISVILSRAKRGFYICGNIQCLANASKIWKKIGEILTRHDAIGNDITNDLFTQQTRLLVCYQKIEF